MCWREGNVHFRIHGGGGIRAWIIGWGVAFLQKPFMLDDLARKVRELLDS